MYLPAIDLRSFLPSRRGRRNIYSLHSLPHSAFSHSLKVRLQAFRGSVPASGYSQPPPGQDRSEVLFCDLSFRILSTAMAEAYRRRMHAIRSHRRLPCIPKTVRGIGGRDDRRTRANRYSVSLAIEPRFTGAFDHGDDFHVGM